MTKFPLDLDNIPRILTDTPVKKALDYAVWIFRKPEHFLDSIEEYPDLLALTEDQWNILGMSFVTSWDEQWEPLSNASK